MATDLSLLSQMKEWSIFSEGKIVIPRFRALLAESGAERLELVRAQRALRARLHNGADTRLRILESANGGGLAFRAELSTNGSERLELVRAQRALGVRLQNGTDALASMRNCINTEVRFRALLTQDETRQLEVVRA